MLVLSNDIGDNDALFEKITELGTVHSRYAIPYENNLKIYLCRNLRQPVEELWQKLKSFN